MFANTIISGFEELLLQVRDSSQFSVHFCVSSKSLSCDSHESKFELNLNLNIFQLPAMLPL